MQSSEIMGKAETVLVQTLLLCSYRRHRKVLYPCHIQSWRLQVGLFSKESLLFSNRYIVDSKEKNYPYILKAINNRYFRFYLEIAMMS
jgi:hypothetical protein